MPPEVRRKAVCPFGGRTLHSLVNALDSGAALFSGGNEVDGIHDLRVATRRIRAVAPLFSDCLPKAAYRRWSRRIKSLTRSLSVVRDLDVQITFLQNYPGEGTGERVPIGRAGVDLLLSRLTAQRAVLMPSVEEAVRSVFGTGSDRAVRKSLECWKDLSKKEYQPYLFEKAAIAITRRIRKLFSFSHAVDLPEAVEEHHAMRIAAKRLRYTMEIFAPIYPGKLKEEVQAVKHLQEVLGELHDCDIWIKAIPAFLEEERKRGVKEYGHEAFVALVEPGLSLLMEERQKERAQKYQEMATYWRSRDVPLLLSGTLSRVCTNVYWAKGAAAPLKPKINGSESFTIAIVANLTGNLPALKAFLADVDARGVSSIVALGDSLTGGPFPGKVASLLLVKDVAILPGERDRAALQRPDGEKEVHVGSIRWTAAELTSDQRASLRASPSIRMMTLGDTRVLFAGTDLFPETPSTSPASVSVSQTPVVCPRPAGEPPLGMVSGQLVIAVTGNMPPHSPDATIQYTLLQVSPFSLTRAEITYDSTEFLEATLGWDRSDLT
jgi:CHAD domain-containing protein